MILCLTQLELREFPTWPMWYCDLYKIKQDWKQAKPILEVVHRLREWGRTPENMQKLNRFLKTGEGVNELSY